LSAKLKVQKTYTMIQYFLVGTVLFLILNGNLVVCFKNHALHSQRFQYYKSLKTGTSFEQETVQEKPDWAGGGFVSDLVNTLIGIKPLFNLMKTGARNVLIQNAEKKGINWQDNTAALLALEEKLEAVKNELTSPSVEYPDYYTREFHGYDDGNLNWLAAAECYSATLSMATRIWPKEDITYQESQQRLRNSYLLPLQEYISAGPKPGAPQSIIDIGCSVGVSTSYLRDFFPGAQVVGIDLSPHFLAVAKYMETERTSSDSVSRNGIKWIHAKAEATGLETSSVDVAMLTFIVHELPTAATNSVLAEVYRILKPGGVVAITDIDPKSPVIQKLPRAISTLMKSTEPWSDQYYSLNMQVMIESVGFEQFKYVVTDPRHSTYYATKPLA